MSDGAQLSKDSPLMQAWEAYTRTEDFANSRTWARIPQHTDGSMWSAFVQGWQLALNAKNPAPEASGVELIATERRRQVEAEGWTSEHDDTHTDGSLAGAAACLAVESTDGDFTWVTYDTSWIRHLHDRHELSGRIRQLEIAGALIAAEIDRLQRAQRGSRDDA